MNNKQAIIDKIIADAQNVASQNIEKAQQQVDAIISQANSKANKYLESNSSKAQKQADEILSRSKTIEVLDARKIFLGAKKQVIDQVFAQAIEQFRKQKDYLDYIQNLIEKNAENGDLVAICPKDKDIITSSFVDKIAKKMNIHISLSSDFCDIGGGIVLVGKNYDKNLSVEMELDAKKEQLEQQLSVILFEENKNA